MNKLALLLVSLACWLGIPGCREDAPARVKPKDGERTVPAAAGGETLPATRVNPWDGAEMVLVPAGEFLMGTSERELGGWLAAQPTDKRAWFAHELPQRSVYLDAYYIYKTEVTVAQYRTFCQATGRKMPEPPSWGWQDAHPVVNVTWDDARAYATWAAVALPTEAQWEKAARGAEARLFPWGDAWPPPSMVGNFADEALLRSGKYAWPEGSFVAGYGDGYAATAPVGCFPAGASPYGVLDMAGNAWEWCADWYDPSYYKTGPTRNPPGPAAAVPVELSPGQMVNCRVFRGGSWMACAEGGLLRCASRLGFVPSAASDQFGFRCARAL